MFDGLFGALGARDSRYFDCPKVLPSLFLTLNGNDVELPASAFFYERDDGKCTLDVDYGQGDSWGFGLNFLRRYCVSVNYGKSQLGIAKNLC